MREMFLEIKSSRPAVFFMFCKTSQVSQESICDEATFGKAVSPHTSNCTQKDAITGVFR